MARFQRFLSKLQVNVEKGFTIAGAVVIAVMMCITVADVTMRKLLSAPIKGSYESITLMFVAVVYCGLAYAQYQHKHISIGILYDRLPPGFRRPVEGLVLSLCLGFFVLVTWQSAIMAVWAWENGNTILGAIHLRTWPSRAVIPVGTGLLSLRFLVQLGGLVMRREEGRVASMVEETKPWT